MYNLFYSANEQRKRPNMAPFGMNGNGTAASPWEITSIQQLRNLASYVNVGNGPLTSGKYYKLMNDIVYDHIEKKGWIPIGNNAMINAIFQGHFDGNSKKVSDIWIRQGGTSYIGLFGYVSGAYIHDLGVEIYQMSIVGQDVGIIGYTCVGGLIGRSNNSIIENCYATGNVTGDAVVGGLVGWLDYGNIFNSYAVCDVNGSVATTGGFVGINDGSITNCYATGDVIGAASQTGGFVGGNRAGEIAYCYAAGNVISKGYFVGGLVGENCSEATLINCVATNNIIILDGASNNINRVSGLNAGIHSNNYAYEGMLVNGATVSGGTQNNVNGEGKPMATLMSFNFYNTGSNWLDDKPWSIDTNDNSLKSWRICDGETLPFLQWEGIGCNATDPCDEPHAGTLSDPFLICTVQDLMDFRDYVNNGNTTIGKYWKMMADLDLVGISNWNPIGNNPYPFQGNFDGNDKVISNLTINMGSTNYIGLFGRIGNAEIKNLGIDSCQITGSQCVGALVGWLSGISTIENCHVVDCNISGYSHIGGLMGYVYEYSNLITIKNCYATGSVTGMETGYSVGGLIGNFRFGTISDSYAICEVSSTYVVGGLAGVGGGNYSAINRCYAGGSVQTTSTTIGDVGGVTGGLIGMAYGIFFNITDCYATGNVTATGESNANIGGLVGESNSSGNIIDCYAVGNITVTGASSNSYIAGLVGGNSTSITNCHADGNVTIIGTSSLYIGGLVGGGPISGNNITNSYAIGNIIATEESSCSKIGGLVGSNYSFITSCYATCDIIVTEAYNSDIGGLLGITSYTNITNCYATGKIVTGLSNSNIGGLVGFAPLSSSDSYITNCYATGDIVTETSNSNVGGLVGYNSVPIAYCYATGNISGTEGTSFGGLAGVNFSSIRNCVAANNTVSGGISNINRVVGKNSGVLSNNYAYEDMLVNSATVISGTQNNANGEDKSMSTLMSFDFYDTGSNWYNNIPWDIAANDNPSKVWKICDTQTLPFFQWQGIVCSKRLPYNEDEEGYTAGQNDKQLAIFPNPASGVMTISAVSEIEQLQIFDIVGRLIHSQTSTSKEVVFDTGILAKEVYLVRALLRDGAVQTGKVVVN